jgi:phosphohistidine swiveling domain-containing protein/predicted nucleic acid-binding protein
MAESWWRAVRAHSELPDCSSDFLFVTRDGFTTGYTTHRQLERSGREGLRFLDDAFRKEFNAKHDAVIKSAEELFVEFKKIESRLRGFSEVELWAWFERYYAQLVDVESFFRISAGRALPLVEQRLKEEVAKRFPAGEVEEKYALLLTPTTIDVLRREQADLLKLASKQSVTDAEIFAHAERYALHFYNTYDRALVKQFIERRIAEERKLARNGSGKSGDAYLAELATEKKKIEALRKQAEQKIADDGVVALAAFLRRQGTMRFETKTYWAGAEYRFLSLLQEIARRAGVGIDEFFAAYNSDSVKELLLENKKLDACEASRRSKINVYLLFDGEKSFFSGEAAEKEAARLLGSEKEEAVTEIRGTPACPGLVEGRVRIVEARGLSELTASLKEFEDGEILVTTMTQPNMVFLMKRAAAIVTNEGGMVSHAAIVSREFGVPCVVGTRKGTKVLKTGDRVIVDANKGIVKKL